MTITSALIDIGGSSVKVTIREISAEKILSHEVFITPKVDGKHIFLDSSQLLSSILQAMNQAASKLPAGSKVDKIYISTLRQGFCLTNSNDELTPIYLNSDISGEFARKDIERYGSQKIYKETGHWFAPQLTLPKLISLFQSRPELKNQNTKLLFVHDWLIWKFTHVILTEMTLVSAGQFADLAKKNIHYQLLEHFGIPLTIIPTPQKFGTPIGGIESSLASQLSSHWLTAEVCVGGGDSHFLHMGASGNQAGKVVVSAGSSTPISLLSFTLGSSTLLQPWKSTSFYDSAYFLEGNVGYPGSFFGWLMKNVSDPISNRKINVQNLSKAPMVFGSCNMWNEERWETRPAFSILGDFSESSSSDLALGMTLDYAFALANQISALIHDNFEINEVILTGGGANSQLQSILKSLIKVDVNLLSIDAAINNLFSTLNDEDLQTLNVATEPQDLDRETREFLIMRSKKHALLYEQVEGTRKILENAR